MSHILWKCYHHEDVGKFRQLLSNGTYVTQQPVKPHPLGAGTAHSHGSPSGFTISPKSGPKHRKVSGQPGNMSGGKGSCLSIGRAEVNSRDYAGLTILHRAASSTSENSISFALALIEHPAIDLYLQDTENGWTALHRALYFGNITIARAIIEKDYRTPSGHAGNTIQRVASSVIKVKDREGNSPFDVYNATTARRSMQFRHEDRNSDSDATSVDEEAVHAGTSVNENSQSIDGDEVFAWGSSRNHGLGFRDQDDRHHPEKITLHRPDHLLFRFYREYLESSRNEPQSLNHVCPFPKSVSNLPTLITSRPIVIQDVVLSKLHSAILTTDPESNLYMCGFGPGGRLGTCDEDTRFSYCPVDSGPLAGKKVTKVALGQNHSLAITSDGSIFSWGSNTYGQLGYTLPRPAMNDEEPVCVCPRQIFGPLKRESIIGVAASALHSVAHTSNSLFTWGKNEGQLGLMDSDSRSLEVQSIPRKVAVSLFKSPINMVSAINSATIVLLISSVCIVFTNYGYNIVKFPLHEGFSNYHLKKNAFTTRYDPSSNRISSITAGGETIGAVTSRGDLFTLTVRSIPTSSATSTTNPAKIKDSLSKPERLWSLRKGNWDGIKSVGITENGSVIVCTQAGAVWRRIKQANSKDKFNGAFKRHDFKFQRIPGLTNVAAVRSTIFGVYVAIRKDCDITKTQITVDEQHLWQDVAPLLSIRGLQVTEVEHGDRETVMALASALPKVATDPLKRAILISPDLEAAVSQHLLGQNYDKTYDVEVGTSTSEVTIPVHGFLLGRSQVLREAITEFRAHGGGSVPDFFVIDQKLPSACVGGRTTRMTLIFQCLDFISLLNLVLYFYTDTLIDVWQFTRNFPGMACRYRQIRTELMKTAHNLKLVKLEAAVRLMMVPEKRLNFDLKVAIQDSNFFNDGDAIVELDGSEMMVHSAFVCRRCPFFEGLFNGRAGGQWLAGRTQIDLKPVRVDLKHIQPDVFRLVLQHIYADIGTELFDDVVCSDIDDFSGLVLDVMAVANELMLDRLSQICQEVMGRFVTTRNICNLLNAIAPFSISAFRDAALEYLCLQLESMLENHLLNDLEEELVLELNEVVRANQLNCLPFAKSFRSDLLLHETYPYLVEDIREERRRRVGDLEFRASLKDEDNRSSSSFKTRIGSFDEVTHGSPSQEKARGKSKTTGSVPFSPILLPTDNTVELMFDMDDDDALAFGNHKSVISIPKIKDSFTVDHEIPKTGRGEDEAISTSKQDNSSVYRRSQGLSTRKGVESSTPTVNTWSFPSLPSSNFDMREIMAQASSSRPSALSMSLSTQNADDGKDARLSLPKLSQKERKKQQQTQALRKTEASADIKGGQTASPWQAAARGLKTSLKDVLVESSSSASRSTKYFASPVPAKSHIPVRTASPDTRFSGQSRYQTAPFSAGSSRPTPPAQTLVQPPAPQSGSFPVVPLSKTYKKPATQAEPSLQLSMAEIIGQQRREQEVIREAVAKRSLQEIQQEQAFQEWWDQESRRAQEEEAARVRAAASSSSASAMARKGKNFGRGRGRRGRGDGGKALG